MISEWRHVVGRAGPPERDSRCCYLSCSAHSPFTRVSLPQSKARDFSAWRINRGSVPRCSRAECSPSHTSPSDMFDKTRTGRIDLFGFSALWEFMQRWRALFQQYDRDHSGSIGAAELQQGMSPPARLRVSTVPTPLLPLLSPVLSSGSHGLQPQPPVLSDAGAALQRPRRTPRHAAGPLHSGVHAAAVHHAVLQGEGHGDVWQHPRQLRGFPVWGHHQAHVSGPPWTVCHSMRMSGFAVFHHELGGSFSIDRRWFNNNRTVLIWTEFQG